MDYKKIKTETEAITRNKEDFYNQTGNIYETVAILSKRANQISVELKTELEQKISEFATSTDNLEEIFENREQIEIAKF
ncbi:MAG: DNA-directed RNA polymerase subunit omega, partial [Bacteroidales bacterium]|nr:DNA-directed RNA polymerase subunit omega [Bacteroidales bacterium]